MPTPFIPVAALAILFVIAYAAYVIHELSLENKILRTQLDAYAKFDHDKDGRPGGKRPHSQDTNIDYIAVARERSRKA